MTNLERHLSWSTHCEEQMSLCATEITPVDMAERPMQHKILLSGVSRRASAIHQLANPRNDQWDLAVSDSSRVPNGNYL